MLVLHHGREATHLFLYLLSVSNLFGIGNSLCLCFGGSRFTPNVSGRPDGQAASDALSQNRAVRVRRERNSRPAPSLLEQQRAREQRARDRMRGREIDEFMSAASVYTADEIRAQQV